MKSQVNKVVDFLKIGDTTYSEDDLTESAKNLALKYKVADQKVRELKLLEFLLKKTKKSYIDEMTKEIITDKSGMIFEDD